MSDGEKHELKLFAGILLVSVIAGMSTGSTLLFVVAGLLLYLSRHAFRLIQLSRTIRHGQRLREPFPPGIWGEVHEALAQASSRARKRKKNLTRYETRFRKATAVLPDALLLLNHNNCIYWANPAADNLLGIAFPADDGKPICDLLALPFLDEYLNKGDFLRPLKFASPRNRRLMLSLQITPFGERKRHRLIVVRDITQAYDLNRVHEDFIANVSHELKTPLTVISASVEILMDGKKRKFQERPLQLIQQQSTRMQSTIKDLLSLSQLEARRDQPVEQMIDVPALLDELIAEAREISGASAHRILPSIDPTLGLLGHRNDLRSAFSNLIFNAVKYTPARAEIRISWQFEEHRARFSVSDTGEGIAARHLPRLTERFYRVDTGRSDKSGGTGLGLSIVKNVVSHHGGELEIHSKEAYGSTFSCLFPRGLFCLIRGADNKADRMQSATPV
jgi:two-component system phosphate regulon sensor histidine kinase PhoR